MSRSATIGLRAASSFGTLEKPTTSCHSCVYRSKLSYGLVMFRNHHLFDTLLVAFVIDARGSAALEFTFSQKVLYFEM